MASLKDEFARRNVKVIGLSVDSIDDHAGCLDDIEETQGYRVFYPIIGDTDLSIAKLYNMLPAAANGGAAGRTAADNATVRTIFVIGPDKCIKLMMSYPMSTGRNFDEVLRVIDSLQLTDEYQVATPVNWHPGEDVIIVPTMSDREARERYPDGWEAPKPYLRYVHHSQMRH